MPLWVGALVFIVFASGGFLVTRFAAWLTKSFEPFRQLTERYEPPEAIAFALACATGIIGTQYVARDSPVLGVALIAVLCFALTFACWCDLSVGRIPALVMLPVLLLLAAIDVAHGAWASIVAALVVTAPFAVAAALSKGRNLAWGDVQVVALGALVLDVSLGLVVLAGACFLTVGVAAARHRLKEPVRFAPYLTAAIALALLTPNSLQ